MPNFNTISLSFGYAESHRVAPLIFQIDASKSEIESELLPKEIWKSFVRFLIAKYKTDSCWIGQQGCGCQTQPTGNFCSNCGSKNKINCIDIYQLCRYFSDLQRKDVDTFGADYYQLEEEFEVDNWSCDFSWENIFSVLEIPVYAERVLAAELYFYAQEFDPEFFATLVADSAWQLDDWILREIQTENRSIFFSVLNAQGQINHDNEIKS